MIGAGSTDGARNTRRAVLVVLLATVAVYARGLDAGFVGDDFMILHRLRALHGPLAALGFFRGEFFEYYRPLPFLLHAADWFIAGYSPLQFHVTNLVLHLACAALVLFIGQTLAPRSYAGLIAALLFALHAANHEAVLWISARFDLLATAFALGAVLSMLRARQRPLLPAGLFLAALLCKESVAALPIAALAASVFIADERPMAAAKRVAPWLLALLAYSALRHWAGGVSAAGGSGRLPKVAALGLVLLVVLSLSGRRASAGMWLQRRRAIILTAGAVLLVVAAVAIQGGRAGALLTDKSAVAGFALFHLASPVVDFSGIPFYLDPQNAWYAMGGLVAVGLASIVIGLLWNRLVDDARLWFICAFLAAALIPVSALTEGTRYLYLPSAAVSLGAGILLAERSRSRTVMALLAAFLAVSAAQVWKKAGDWNWAGRMTGDGARLVDDALAPSCGEGHVVFLTAPVAVRGVYTHFYYETFEPPRGCMPQAFQVLVRVVRRDPPIDVKWDGPFKIVITVPAQDDNLALSRDLRTFDIRPGAAPVSVQTPLGRVDAHRVDDMESVSLTLDPAVDSAAVRFFYYSRSRMNFFPPTTTSRRGGSAAPDS